MELYHTQTREDYKALIDELSAQRFKWQGNQKPHEFDGFEAHESGTIIKVSDDGIGYCSMSFYKEYYNKFELIEYKAEKSEKDIKISNESVLEIIENLVQATNLKSLYSLQKSLRKLDILIENLID